MATVVLSSPVTSLTRSSNRCTHVARLLMITNDIRIILCTSLSAAEEIKVQYGCVTNDIDSEVKIPVPSVSDKPDTETTKTILSQIKMLKAKPRKV